MNLSTLACPTVSIGPQLHVAHARWLGDVLEKNLGRTTGVLPSLPPGLWTSTETAPFRSAYSDLCLQTTLARGGPRWPPAAMVRLEVVGAPRVLRIASVADLWDAYFDVASGPVYDLGREVELTRELVDVDDADLLVRHFAAGHVWDKLASALDAVHFADDGDDDLDRIAVEWGCESTCWLRPWPHLRVVDARRLAEDAAPLSTRSEPSSLPWF